VAFFFDSKTPISTALANNGQGSAVSYQFREHWKKDGMPSDMSDLQPVDLWYGRLFHGRINGAGDVIYPSETNLKQLPADGTDTFWALDFVVDAFADLQLHMKRAVGRGLISPDSTVASFEPARAWVSANLDYNAHMEKLYDHMVTSWLQKGYRNTKIKKFSDFLREFLELIDDAARTIPFTKSAYILSKYFSPLSSGLIVEITEGDHSLDIIKQKSWVEDPNFSFYRNAAKNHGFLIDKNAPWRLIADVNSAPMAEYMSQYGVSGKDLFDSYYYKSHRQDIEALKIYLIEMYNAYTVAYPEVKELRTKMRGAGGVRTVSRLTTRHPITLEEVDQNFGPEYWLKTYYYIRLREMQAPIDNVMFNNEVEKIYRRYKFLDFERALDYINGKIKKLKVP
tara:strand:- start:249 stop:1436 length:1188 start_codon:yes stop_codon:yes gene_type:complete